MTSLRPRYPVNLWHSGREKPSTSIDLSVANVWSLVALESVSLLWIWMAHVQASSLSRFPSVLSVLEPFRTWVGSGQNYIQSDRCEVLYCRVSSLFVSITITIGVDPSETAISSNHYMLLPVLAFLSLLVCLGWPQYRSDLIILRSVRTGSDCPSRSGLLMRLCTLGVDRFSTGQFPIGLRFWRVTTSRFSVLHPASLSELHTFKVGADQYSLHLHLQSGCQGRRLWRRVVTHFAYLH